MSLKLPCILLTCLINYALVQPQDHSEFIEGPFESPQEVTEACMLCHETAGDEIIKTRHWNWTAVQDSESVSSSAARGKKNFLNNFCIAVPSNLPRCTSCHIGYGWKDEHFDFEDTANIDCLVCHDRSGQYMKTPTGAGMPSEKTDLLTAARSVGMSTRKNCGTCHFDGGGGTGVKHGDMDDSLIEPAADIDFHMGSLDFQCTECHTVSDHNIAGASHGSLADNTNHIGCDDCHGEAPHEKELLNRHFQSVACETCHIPVVAKEIPTKIWWDWSKAGMDSVYMKDRYGMDTYDKKKGEFIWAKNLKPDYYWHNGKAEYYEFGEKIRGDEPVRLNSLDGRIKDKNSKISPFKVMRGKQPYDRMNKYLIVPKLFGKDGYWSTFNWVSSAELGMKQVNLNFSGEIGFVETEMYWPLNHMVSPKEKALKCTNCHGIKGDHYLDWKKLGYPDDPMKKGGRGKLKLIKAN